MCILQICFRFCGPLDIPAMRRIVSSVMAMVNTSSRTCVILCNWTLCRRVMLAGRAYRHLLSCRIISEMLLLMLLHRNSLPVVFLWLSAGAAGGTLTQMMIAGTDVSRIINTLRRRAPLMAETCPRASSTDGCWHRSSGLDV